MLFKYIYYFDGQNLGTSVPFLKIQSYSYLTKYVFIIFMCVLISITVYLQKKKKKKLQFRRLASTACNKIIQTGQGVRVTFR